MEYFSRFILRSISWLVFLFFDRAEIFSQIFRMNHCILTTASKSLFLLFWLFASVVSCPCGSLRLTLKSSFKDLLLLGPICGPRNKNRFLHLQYITCLFLWLHVLLIFEPPITKIRRSILSFLASAGAMISPKLPRSSFLGSSSESKNNW